MDDAVYLQILVVVLLVDLMVLLLLMGFLLWLQRRAVAEQDREREAERQRLAAHRAGRFPPSWNPPPR